MKVFITGIAGFIGFHTAMKMINLGHEVFGLDNFNDYYDVSLKRARQKKLLEDFEIKTLELDVFDAEGVMKAFREIRPDLVIHLAASAGVRHSIDFPEIYINNNIMGTQYVINACEAAGVQNAIYASTSCVMHGNSLPWNEEEKLGHQLSAYGYSKAANEHQFHISRIPNAVGLRFFTVYGPWGRPDMALFTFTKNIIEDKPIIVYNYGDMQRDFTYVEDIVQGIVLVSQNMSERNIYNIGNGRQVPLMHFISEIEKNIGKEAEKQFEPRHPADAKDTWSDITKLKMLGYDPKTPVEEGVKKFVEWYRNYYSV